jgi:LysM repeat protein
MGAKIIAGLVGLVVLIVFAQSYVLGGGGTAMPTASRPGSIPTATPPAQTPEPILLGQVQGAGGGTPRPGASGATYTVRSGDTLVAIAANLNVPADQQAAWIAEVLRLNNMRDARELQVGQELRLPAITAAAATGTPSRTATPAGSPTASGTRAAGTATPTPTSRAAGSGRTYTVVSGDYPLLIAEKHCVENPLAWAQELLDLNDTDASSLRVGQELQLPAGTPPQCQTSAPTSTPAPATQTPVP